jgi:hypothetical protein
MAYNQKKTWFCAVVFRNWTANLKDYIENAKS